MVATAIRYAQLVDIPAAIIVSTGQTIDYCFMSKSLEEIDGHCQANLLGGKEAAS